MYPKCKIDTGIPQLYQFLDARQCRRLELDDWVAKTDRQHDFWTEA